MRAPASSPDELLQLCARWRVLTDGEHAAIRARNWPGLALIQEDKRRLMTLIETAAGPATARDAAADLRAPGSALRAAAAELVELERRNLNLLGQMRHDGQSEHEAWQCSGRRLRQVHRAYAPAHSPRWQAYS